MSNEVYREEILTALTPPKQLHVREIADFTAGRDDRVVTRKYVLLDEYERLAGNLRDCREVLRSTDEALQDSACEIERLTRELEAMEDARDIAQAEGALMEMDRDRLHAALEEYGRHESPCLGGGGDSRGCSCGFTKALGEPKP